MTEEHGEKRQALSGKAATQERILVAATELFLEQGYERTTVAEVAERAGVSRATVFWHFSDKGGLFREAFNRLVEPFRLSLERNFDELDPEKRLTEQIALYQSFANRQRVALEGFVRWAIEAQDFREAMINRLLDMQVEEIFEQLELEIVDRRQAERPVLAGGPVQPGTGFVLPPAPPVGRPTSTRWILPIRPLKTSSAAWRNRPSERCWLPVCQTRPWRWTASHMARPSRILRAKGFWPWISHPASAAAMAGRACQ